MRHSEDFVAASTVRDTVVEDTVRCHYCKVVGNSLHLTVFAMSIWEFCPSDYGEIIRSSMEN